MKYLIFIMFFFRRLLYFLLRIKGTEAVKITENTDINGLLYNYRKNMYVCPKGGSILVYDAKKNSISDVEIYEDECLLDFVIDTSKKEFTDITKMVLKHTKLYIYIYILAFLTLY